MALVLVTAPTIEPLTLAELKEHLRVTSDDENSYLSALITAARQQAELWTRRALLTQTYRLTLDEFPAWEIALPRPPLASVTSIVYVDSAGTSQTLSASEYTVDTDSEPGRVTPSWGNVWPSTREVVNAVKITYVAGWTTAALVPRNIRLGVMQLAASYYEHREPVVTGTITAEIPLGVRHLLLGNRVTVYP